MKKLQQNFTTPEQSKRLLELGVPSDSADCCFYMNTNYSDNPHILYKKLSEKQADYDSPLSSIKAVLYPCWSVGRLIEILEIILSSPWSDHQELGKSTLTERVLRDFEDVVKYKEIFKDNRIDFSKLEE